MSRNRHETPRLVFNVVENRALELKRPQTELEQNSTLKDKAYLEKAYSQLMIFVRFITTERNDLKDKLVLSDIGQEQLKRKLYSQIAELEAECQVLERMNFRSYLELHYAKNEITSLRNMIPQGVRKPMAHVPPLRRRSLPDCDRHLPHEPIYENLRHLRQPSIHLGSSPSIVHHGSGNPSHGPSISPASRHTQTLHRTRRNGISSGQCPVFPHNTLRNRQVSGDELPLTSSLHPNPGFSRASCHEQFQSQSSPRARRSSATLGQSNSRPSGECVGESEAHLTPSHRPNKDSSRGRTPHHQPPPLTSDQDRPSTHGMAARQTYINAPVVTCPVHELRNPPHSGSSGDRPIRSSIYESRESREANGGSHYRHDARNRLDHFNRLEKDPYRISTNIGDSYLPDYCGSPDCHCYSAMARVGNTKNTWVHQCSISLPSSSQTMAPHSLPMPPFSLIMAPSSLPMPPPCQTMAPSSPPMPPSCQKAMPPSSPIIASSLSFDNQLPMERSMYKRTPAPLHDYGMTDNHRPMRYSLPPPPLHGSSDCHMTHGHRPMRRSEPTQERSMYNHHPIRDSLPPPPLHGSSDRHMTHGHRPMRRSEPMQERVIYNHRPIRSSEPIPPSVRASSHCDCPMGAAENHDSQILYSHTPLPQRHALQQPRRISPSQHSRLLVVKTVENDPPCSFPASSHIAASSREGLCDCNYTNMFSKTSLPLEAPLYGSPSLNSRERRRNFSYPWQRLPPISTQAPPTRGRPVTNQILECEGSQTSTEVSSQLCGSPISQEVSSPLPGSRISQEVSSQLPGRKISAEACTQLPGSDQIPEGSKGDQYTHK